MFETLLIASLPLLFASLGGLVTERAGILNIALEGIILSSAFFTLHGASVTNSIWAGLAMGMMVSSILALVFITGTFFLKGDPFVIGLGINLASYPLISVASRFFYQTEGTVRPDLFPELPYFLFPVLGIVLFLLTLYIIDISPWGLLIKMCGKREGKLKEKGHSPLLIKACMVWLGSLMAGLAGSFLSLNLAVYVPNMSAGKGWMALVAVYAAGNGVKGLIPALLVFSFFDMAAISLQSLSWLPSELVLSLPYFFSVLILFIINRIRYAKKVS